MMVIILGNIDGIWYIYVYIYTYIHVQVWFMLIELMHGGNDGNGW